jgi:hypothetical protein
MTRYKADKYPWGKDDPEVTDYTQRRIRELRGELPLPSSFETDPYIVRYFARQKGQTSDVKSPL